MELVVFLSIAKINDLFFEQINDLFITLRKYLMSIKKNYYDDRK